jgi:hypothetical protein
MGYDAQPYKIRPCYVKGPDCTYKPAIPTSSLPDPGVRLDPIVDHWHVFARGGADNRGARDLMKWRTIALSVTRCEHGRVQEDVCYGCPGGFAPDRSGTRIGTDYTGRPIVIPPRGDHSEPEEWYG